MFFGSTVKRFEAKAGTVAAAAEVGPGSYDAKLPEANLKPPKSGKHVAFSVGENRWQKGSSLKGPEDDVPIPGPGTYAQPGIAENAKIKTWGKNGVFGSTERRFVEHINLKTPGPGQYG